MNTIKLIITIANNNMIIIIMTGTVGKYSYVHGQGVTSSTENLCIDVLIFRFSVDFMHHGFH